MDKSQEIFDRAAEARIFLHIHDFLSESENRSCQARINKYGNSQKVNMYSAALPVKKKKKEKAE